MRLVFVMCFKMRKLSGYIFRLYLVTEDENFESSVVTVKLLRVNFVLVGE
jgi:hypothetical protein